MLARRLCRAFFSLWGLGGVGWDNHVHVPRVRTWCCAAATSLVGGWKRLGGVRWFASRRTRNGILCLCTLVVSKVCGRFPQVWSQALREHAKVVLLTHSSFKEFGFGNGDGTMEIAFTSSVSLAALWANAWRSETPKAEVKNDHHPGCTKPCL